MAENIPRHRVFISYHDEDREYKDSFVRNMGDSIIDESKWTTSTIRICRSRQSARR